MDTNKGLPVLRPSTVYITTQRVYHLSLAYGLFLAYCWPPDSVSGKSTLSIFKMSL
uniref:Uncharacterized protein n=1 Tax=Rhodnius prolixus TaxID=13249 RepID=A0A905R0M5_RHOPR